MDVRSVSPEHRELELAQRLLREREEAHAKELEHIQDTEEERVEELSKAQSETLDRLRKKASESAQSQRDQYDRELERLSDSYDRTVATDRREGYDKLGRLSREYAREANRERALKSKQIEELVTQQNRGLSGERTEREQRIKGIRDKFENDREALRNHYDHKFEEQRILASDQRADAADSARQKVDKNIRDMHERASRDRLSADLKYEQLARQSQDEVAAKERSHAARENQLAGEKTLTETRASTSGTKALEEYKQRLNDNFSQTVNDHNAETSKKNQDHAARIGQLEHQHHSKEQSLKGQIRQAENDLKFRSAGEKERNDAVNDLRERRHRQDLYLHTEALRKNDELNRQVMAERYNEQLHDNHEKAQRAIHKNSTDLNRRIQIQQMQSSGEKALADGDKTRHLAEQQLHYEKDRHRLIRNYEDRQRDTDELRERQVESTKEYYGQIAADTKANADKTVSRSNRENTAKTYETRENFRTTTDEMMASHKMRESELEQNYEDRVKRLTGNYHRNLITQKDSFDDITGEMKYESTVKMTKVRQDAERDKRLQLMELQAKNRTLIQNYEAKMNELKDAHEADRSRAKAENDKTVRDTIKRTEEALERQRSQYDYQLAIKDRQMTEKLKLQEEAFRNQIEKIRRTNELALKKS